VIAHGEISARPLHDLLDAGKLSPQLLAAGIPHVPVTTVDARPSP